MTGASRVQRRNPGFLKPAEVLSRLRVNIRTVYRLIATGELPAVRVGRQWRVRPGDLDSWLRRQEAAVDLARIPRAD